MAISKVILNNNVLMDVTQTTVTGNNLLSPHTAIRSNGELVTGIIRQSTTSKWQRPNDWPDYDKLNLETNPVESIYLTYDNRLPGGFVSLEVDPGYWNLERVRIENNGNVTVLSTSVVTNAATYYETIPSDAGDWVSYRVTPASGYHIKVFSMSDCTLGDFEVQRCVERYACLPFLEILGRHWGYRALPNYFVQSDTFLSLPDNLEQIEWQNCYSLENIYINSKQDITFWRSTMLRNFDWSTHKINPSRTSIADYFRECSLEYVDLSNSTCNNLTSLSYMCYNSKQLKYIKLPNGDYSNVTNTSNLFNGCSALEVVDFPSGFTCSIGNIFQEDYCLRAIIFRANSVVPLTTTSNFPVRGLCKNGGRIFVPSAQITNYQAASNWSTLYTTYPDMFAAIEGSAFE